MGEWRLTPDGEAVLAGWKKAATATAAHQHRLAEVLDTIGNGTWKGRWWNRPYLPNPTVAEIRAGDGLIVLMRDLVDGDEPVTWIDLVSVSVVDDDEADLGFPRD